MSNIEKQADRVLVTGASGFIASHVVQQLLQAGYKVRGTVRSLSNHTKVKHLKSLHIDSTFPLELVEADLTNQPCWISAVKDCDYVLHVASPFPIENPKNEDELIIPAVEGTKNVLEACASTPSVKRVVLTSSVAAVVDFSIDTEEPATESDWPNIDYLDPYSKSKMLAEKAAWSFMDELEASDNHKFDLAVINPAYVMGPILSGSSCSSMEVIRRLMCRNPPLIPKINFNVVDVRDVAAAHLAAITNPEAKGQRFIIAAGNMWMADISRTLNEEFHDQGYRPSQTIVPHFLFRVVAKFDTGAKRIAPFWGKNVLLDNSKMKAILKIEPQPLKKTLVDMAYSLIEGGFIKKSNRYKGKNASTKAEDDKMSPGSSVDSAPSEEKSCNPDGKGPKVETFSQPPTDSQ